MHSTYGEVERERMPPWFYVIAHPDAKLSESETKEFMNGLVATFGEEHED